MFQLLDNVFHQQTGYITDNHIIMSPACYTDCKENRVVNNSMVRCCLCMIWIHNTCAGTDLSDGVWCCMNCRKMPAAVTSLGEVVAKLADSMNTLLINDTKKSTEAKYIEDIANLTAENKLLKDEIIRLKSGPKPEDNLVIGGSLLRRVSTKKLIKTEVRSVGNSKINDAKNTVSNSVKKYDNITLMVGGNDCDTSPPPPVEQVIGEYESLLAASLDKAESLTVCSICPRLGREDVNQTITSVNAALVALCSDKENVNFLDLDPIFKLGDGSINDGYYENDGIHITTKALNKLCTHMDLKIKSREEGCIAEKIETKDTNDGGWQRKPEKERPTTIKASPQQHTLNTNYGVKHNVYANNYNRPYCMKCGESNHRTNFCNFNVPATCTICFEKGHKSKFCNLYHR